MRVVISAQGEERTSLPDPRFGRAAFFVVMDSEKEEIIEVHANDMKDASGGAGVASAQKISGIGADVLITGALGPKAFAVIKELGIDVFSHNNESNLHETLLAFKGGRLVKLSNPK